MPRPKPLRRLPPEVLTPGEARALLDACGDRTHTAVRNRALLALLYRSGLRVSEALSLYPKDVDAARSAVRVLHGKGGRSRTVGIDAGGLALLRPWLERRRELGLCDRCPLFCTVLWGEPIQTGYVRRLMPRLARKAGVMKRAHPHGLRHTHAAELREEGVDIALISKQLGHRSIATTVHYLDHIAPWSVVEAVSSRCWDLAEGAR